MGAVEYGKEWLSSLSVAPRSFSATLVPRLFGHLFVVVVVVVGLVVVGGVVACVAKMLRESINEIGDAIFATVVACTIFCRSTPCNEAKSTCRRYCASGEGTSKSNAICCEFIHRRGFCICVAVAANILG